MNDQNNDSVTRAKARRKTGGGSAKARRKAARLAAAQALYQIDLTGAAVDTVISEFVHHRIGETIDDVAFVAADPQLFADIVRGTSIRKAEVDGLLTSALDPRFPIERLEMLLRAILRAGGFELFADPATPPRIIISEYVDVAKAFFAGREPGMVNAVLDNIARTLRPDEMNRTDESADD
jgi:transcription antitermination protein NusB